MCICARRATGGCICCTNRGIPWHCAPCLPKFSQRPAAQQGTSCWPKNLPPSSHYFSADRLATSPGSSTELIDRNNGLGPIFDVECLQDRRHVIFHCRFRQVQGAADCLDR